MSQKKRSKETICIQGGWKPANGEARVLPIYQSTTFKYDDSDKMGRLFIPDLLILPAMPLRQKYVSWKAGWQLCLPLPVRLLIFTQC